MSFLNAVTPQHVEGTDDFIKGMQDCGYDIQPHYLVGKSHQDLMLAMARRIVALEAQVDTHEKDLYQRVRVLEDECCGYVGTDRRSKVT